MSPVFPFESSIEVDFNPIDHSTYTLPSSFSVVEIPSTKGDRVIDRRAWKPEQLLGNFGKKLKLIRFMALLIETSLRMYRSHDV